MIYIFDTSSFIVSGHFFPNRFPTFWENFNDYVARGKIISVREVLNELDQKASVPHLREWIKANKNIFLVPTTRELAFVSKIFEIKHYQQIIDEEHRLKGNPVADPFLVASAKIYSGCVVTEEKEKPNAAKIPNVCKHFDIDCLNLEGFMEKEGWKF